MDKDVFAVEKNIRGAWVIYGALGVRQYYGYTKCNRLQNIGRNAARRSWRNKRSERIVSHPFPFCGRE